MSAAAGPCFNYLSERVVRTAFGNWLAYVRAVRETEIVRQARRQDHPVMVHGWIYDLREGLLRDLDLN